jgi:peptide/nickel transport system substrate-binding protein
MKYLMNVLFSSLVIICTWNCGTHKNQDVSGNLSDSVKCIRPDEADTFYSDWSKENTLIFQIAAEPDNLHPSNGISDERSLIFSLTQRYLIAYDAEHTGIRPDLVKKLPEISVSGLEYTYEIKENVFWNDGSAVTSDDVVFTFKANKCSLTDNAPLKSLVENIRDIVPDKVNNKKFTMVMKKKYIQNVAFLTDFPVMQRKFHDPDNILSKYSFTKIENCSSENTADKLIAWAKAFNASENGRTPSMLNGLGLYSVSKWDEGVSVTLLKKKNYKVDSLSVYDVAYPEKIVFVVNRDPNSQMLEFKSQTYDASASIDTRSLLTLLENKDFNRNYNAAFLQTFNYTYMAMNMKPDGMKHKKIFDDVNVRRAMAMLVPVEDIIKLADNGKSKPVCGPVSPLKCGFNSTLVPEKYNLEKAVSLLEKAGWKDADGDNVREKTILGKKTNLEFDLNYISVVPVWKDIALLIKESAAEAGIKINCIPMDVMLMFEKAAQHDFDAFLGSWGGNSAPDDFTQLWHTSSWTSGGSNFTGFGTATSDALIDSIKYCVVDSLRLPMVKRFQKIVYDQQPYVFIKSGVRKMIIHKRFGNAAFYFEKPYIILNTLKLLYGSKGVAYKQMSSV